MASESEKDSSNLAGGSKNVTTKQDKQKAIKERKEREKKFKQAPF